MLDLAKLEKELDDALNGETDKSLKKWYNKNKKSTVRKIRMVQLKSMFVYLFC